MSGRDVCKPVASCAVSVNTAVCSLSHTQHGHRLSRLLRPPIVRKRARPRSSRLSLGGRGRPSPPLAVEGGSLEPPPPRRPYGSVRCVRDSFGPIGSFVSSCPLPPGVPFPSSSILSLLFYFLSVRSLFIIIPSPFPLR